MANNIKIQIQKSKQLIIRFDKGIQAGGGGAVFAGTGLSQDENFLNVLFDNLSIGVNPSNQIYIKAKGVTGAMIDDATIDLVTKVTGILSVAHGGTGGSTATEAKNNLGLGNVTDDAQVKRSEMGVANGVATLDITGKVLSSQLPSYVDDVLEYANYLALPVTGESGKIYVTIDDNKTYRWGGSTYVVISDTIALGETSATAYRGDRGKTAYDHSQLLSGNPHNVTKTDVGLANVDNTTDLAKPISTATQTALNTKADSSSLASKADDSAVVHNTGAENIGGVKTFTSVPTVPADAYDATGWNGNNGVPTKDAIRDKFESLPTGAVADTVAKIAGVTLTNGVYKAISGTIASGSGGSDVTAYTVPAGKKVIMLQSWFRNASASLTTNLVYKVKIGATTYLMSPQSTIGTSGGLFNNNALFYPVYIYEPGEVIILNSSAAVSLAYTLSIVEFDSTVPLYSKKVASPATSGNSTLYTVPSGKVARILNLNEMTMGAIAGFTGIFVVQNVGGNTYSAYIVKSGASPSDAINLMGANSVNAGTISGYNGGNVNLAVGDYVVMNFPNNSTAQIAWVNVVEW